MINKEQLLQQIKENKQNETEQRKEKRKLVRITNQCRAYVYHKTCSDKLDKSLTDYINNELSGQNPFSINIEQLMSVYTYQSPKDIVPYIKEYMKDNDWHIKARNFNIMTNKIFKDLMAWNGIKLENNQEKTNMIVYIMDLLEDNDFDVVETSYDEPFSALVVSA